MVLERLPDGAAAVRMANNIMEDDRDGQNIYVYDEVVFHLDADRTETEADIQADFATWWEYGSQPEEPMPTIEERLELVEMMLMGGMA